MPAVGQGRSPRPCRARARFDVLAHHPYSVGRPRRKAINPDDVSIPDIVKLTRLLRTAERSGRALPRKRHAVWVTETSYDSSPPDPDGVPAATHARWLQEAFFLLWRQGVDTITWFQIRDQLPAPSFAATNQSGVYLADGRAKPAARAFRFPLVAERATRRSHRVWGRSPLAGRVTIERRSGAGWRKVRTVQVKRGATFLLRIATTVPRVSVYAPGSGRREASPGPLPDLVQSQRVATPRVPSAVAFAAKRFTRGH